MCGSKCVPCMQKGQILFKFVREVTAKTGLTGISVHAKLSYTVIYSLRSNNAILKEAVLYLPT
jgi:hypothetical protein